MPIVSVVITCYNLGQFLNEAVDSVINQTFQDYEIIIIDDGSTDPNTIKILDNFDKPKTKVIRTSNQGLAAARNNGIKEAIGEYILPLDADDKIAPTYIEKAIELLTKDKSLGIVYSLAVHFGCSNDLWTLPEYKFPDILDGNVIFCSALYRRKDWETVGGYYEKMKKGLQDYEFWLSLIEIGCKVHRIDEILFYYRIREEGSMHFDTAKIQAMISNKLLIYNKHKEMYKENMDFIYSKYLQSIKDHRAVLDKYETEIKFLKKWSLLFPYFLLKKIIQITKLKLKR